MRCSITRTSTGHRPLQPALCSEEAANNLLWYHPMSPTPSAYFAFVSAVNSRSVSMVETGQASFSFHILQKETLTNWSNSEAHQLLAVGWPELTRKSSMAVVLIRAEVIREVRQIYCIYFKKKKFGHDWESNPGVLTFRVQPCH